MLNSDVLEVAIGMTAVYLLLSLVCSTLTEFVSGIFAMRARDLEKNIRKLLGDPGGSGLAKDFYAHPLIAGAAAPRGLRLLPKNGGKPSYVGARSFALTATSPRALPRCVRPWRSARTTTYAGSC